MKLRLFLLVFCLGLSIYTNAQVSEYGRFITDTLASDAFKGRGYLGEGHLLAANYIKSEFKRFGLVPLESLNATAQPFFQEFEMPVVFVEEPLLLKVNGKELIPGKDFIVDPSSVDAKGCKKVNSVDYYDEVRIEYTKPLGVRKPLVVRFHIQDPRSMFFFTSGLKSEEIKESPIITLHEKLTWNIASGANRKTEIKIREGSLTDPIKRVKYHINTEERTVKSQNVLGVIPGVDQPDSFIVICGHYDHLGMMGSGAIFNGANDNASGIAIILDMLRTWREEKYRPPYSLLFIAFGGEEAGLVGSKHFVNSNLINISKVKFVLNLDLMGTGGAGITLVNSIELPEYYNVMKGINDQEYMLLKLSKRKNTQNSDHWPFTEKGIPAFFIYAMGNWTNYHDVHDRPENLPLTRFNDMRDLFKDFVEEIPKFSSGN